MHFRHICFHLRFDSFFGRIRHVFLFLLEVVRLGEFNVVVIITKHGWFWNRSFDVLFHAIHSRHIIPRHDLLIRND